MSDAGSPGAGANLAEDDKPVAAQEKRRFFSDRFRYRLRNVGAAIASVAAIGAVIGGLTGYWNAWKAISNDVVKVKTSSPTVGPTISKGPSVAVLAIANPTKATVLDPIADTMAQQLVSSLGKFSLLRVIPRATTANFLKRGNAIEAARGAGVDYLVTGEVRPLGEGARANMQLADLRSGNEIWSKSFDATAEGVQTLTDAYEIGDIAATQISSAVDTGEYKKIQNKPVADLNSYECIIQSRVGAAIGSQSAGLRALECSKRLTENEPNNALAWATQVTVLLSQRYFGFGLAPDLVQHAEKRLYLNEEIIRAATRAVELAPDDATVRRIFAQAIGTKCQVDIFRQEVQKAVALNPNDPVAVGYLGISLAFMGDWDDGSALAEKAIRLTGPNASYLWWFGPAKRHWWRGEYQQALEDFRHAYIEGFWLSHSGEGRTEHYADLARDVVSAHPDLIFAATGILSLHLKMATTTIPIVTITADPIAIGLVPSIAHPGGNITGVTTDGGVELYGKRLGLLVEAVPKVSNVRYLASNLHWERPSGVAAREAARRAGISMTGALLGMTFNEAAYQRVFNSMAQDQVDGLLVSDEAEHFTYRRLLVELAAKSRIPAMYPYREHAELGGLMSYSIDLLDTFRRAAGLTAEILKGVNPGEIPFSQPTHFDLVINLKTSRALGLELPPMLVARADEVIE